MSEVNPNTEEPKGPVRIVQSQIGIILRLKVCISHTENEAGKELLEKVILLVRSFETMDNDRIKLEANNAALVAEKIRAMGNVEFAEIMEKTHEVLSNYYDRRMILADENLDEETRKKFRSNLKKDEEDDKIKELFREQAEPVFPPVDPPVGPEQPAPDPPQENDLMGKFVKRNGKIVPVNDPEEKKDETKKSDDKKSDEKESGPFSKSDKYKNYLFSSIFFLVVLVALFFGACVKQINIWLAPEPRMDLVEHAPVWQELAAVRKVITGKGLNPDEEVLALIRDIDFQMSDKIVLELSGTDNVSIGVELEYKQGEARIEYFDYSKELVVQANADLCPKAFRVWLTDSATAVVKVKRAYSGGYEQRDPARQKQWEEFVSYDYAGLANDFTGWNYKDQVEVLVQGIDYKKEDKIIVRCASTFWINEYVETGIDQWIQCQGEKELVVQYTWDNNPYVVGVLASEGTNITTTVMRYQ